MLLVFEFSNSIKIIKYLLLGYLNKNRFCHEGLIKFITNFNVKIELSIIHTIT